MSTQQTPAPSTSERLSLDRRRFLSASGVVGWPLEGWHYAVGRRSVGIQGIASLEARSRASHE